MNKVGQFCEHCGEFFLTWPYRVRDGIRFCSEQCKITWLAKNFSGINSPHWRGGETEDYGRQWDKISLEVRQKANWTCFVCDSKPKRNDLIVHHMTPLKVMVNLFGKELGEKAAHNESNLVPLCRHCHMVTEHESLKDLPLNKKELAVSVWLSIPDFPFTEAYDKDYSSEWL